LLAERAILATQPAHLLLLHGRQSVLAPSSITVGLPNPIPDRLGRGFELAPQFFGRPSLPHQFDDALSELRRVRPMALRHRGHSFPPQPWGVHQTGSTPVVPVLRQNLIPPVDDSRCSRDRPRTTQETVDRRGGRQCGSVGLLLKDAGLFWGWGGEQPDGRTARSWRTD